MKTMEKYEVSDIFFQPKHMTLCSFHRFGKVFQTKVYEVHEGQRANRGRGLMNFLEISTQDKVLSVKNLDKPKTRKKR